jgi:hypothetical protein
MAQPTQNLANHARYVPLFHFVCLPLLMAYLAHAVLALRAHPSENEVWQLILAVALILLAWFARAFALTAQDRVIRLELSLRVQRLAPELAARYGQLTPGQFVALRFASDPELPGLLREVLDGKLTSGSEIKKRITDWQGDYLRV